MKFQLNGEDGTPYINVHGDIVLVDLDLVELPSFINFGEISGKFSISANYGFKTTRGFPKVCERVHCYVHGTTLYRPVGFKGNCYNVYGDGEVSENGAHTDGTFEDYDSLRLILEPRSM